MGSNGVLGNEELEFSKSSLKSREKQKSSREFGLSSNSTLSLGSLASMKKGYNQNQNQIRQQQQEKRDTSHGNNNNKISREFPADLRPLVFKKHANPNLSKSSQEPPESVAEIREKLLQNSGSNLTANTNTAESVIRSVLGSIDRDQFEDYLKNPRYIKLMKKDKNLKQFRRLFLAQELRIQEDTLGNGNGNGNVLQNGQALDTTSIWTTKFSCDGKYMASGSKGGSIWIWKVLSSPGERWEMDYKEEIRKAVKRKTMMLQRNRAISNNLSSGGSHPHLHKKGQKVVEKSEKDAEKISAANLYAPVFQPQAHKVFREHESSVLDLDWSKNGFLVSASMDKTVLLWHVKRENSLRTFHHPDFVTCVRFYPPDDRFFVTGCLDHKCRMWSILDDEIIFEFDCEDLITSMALTPDMAKFTVIGTFNGYIYVLETQGLRLVSSFHITDKETQKNTGLQVLSPGSKLRHGPRVTCLQCFKAPNDKLLKLMTVSNDSRVRIFELDTKKCVEVLKGFESGASQHNAHLVTSKTQAVVVSGSNDHWVYGWKLQSASIPEQSLRTSVTSQDNGSIKRSGSFRNLLNKNKSKTTPVSSSATSDSKHKSNDHNIHSHLHNRLHLKNLVKHGHNSNADQYIKNGHSISFHAHHAPVTTSSIAPPETAKALSLSNDLICELSLLLYRGDDELKLLGGSKKSPKHNDDGFNDSDAEASDWDNCMSFSNGQAMPSVVDAMGTIMITTDTTGLIRVFRADMSSSIRRRVLKRLEDSIADETFSKSKVGSSDSLTSVQNMVRSSSFNGGLNTVKSPNNASGNSYNSRSPTILNSNPIQARPPLGRPGSGSGFRSALLNRSNSSIGSSKGNNGDFNREEGVPVRSNSLTSPKMRCDVCGSTKFNRVSRGSFSGREEGYYCTDCSTLNNNFR